jgi:hypothetical protein
MQDVQAVAVRCRHEQLARRQEQQRAGESSHSQAGAVMCRQEQTDAREAAACRACLQERLTR